MKEKIVKHLTDGFLGALEKAHHAGGTQQLAQAWAMKRYEKLSKKEKQEILNKIKS